MASRLGIRRVTGIAVAVVASPFASATTQPATQPTATRPATQALGSDDGIRNVLALRMASGMYPAERPRRDLPGSTKSQIGLNWFTAQPGQVEFVWHNGGTGSYRTSLGIDKAHRRGVVVLASANSVDDIGRHVLDPSLPLAEGR